MRMPMKMNEDSEINLNIENQPKPNCKIQANRAKIWQIALFSLNNTSTNLFLAMMGYVSYYANGIAGIGVVLISFILTGMRVFDSVTDPMVGYIIDKTNGRYGKFRPFMVAGYLFSAFCYADAYDRSASESVLFSDSAEWPLSLPARCAGQR